VADGGASGRTGVDDGGADGGADRESGATKIMDALTDDQGTDSEDIAGRDSDGVPIDYKRGEDGTINRGDDGV
jgi:hypothetical protein